MNYRAGAEIFILLLTYTIALVRKQTIPTERPPLVGVVPTSADRGCHMVSVTDPYGRILGFLDQYFFSTLIITGT
jgi:CBS-domain-containing membrane protein